MAQRILSIIGWLGTALVVVGAAVGFVPALDRYAPYMRPLAIAGLVCLLAYMLGQWREMAQMFARRQARYGALAGASTIIVLGILIAINYIGKSEHKRWDLTASKQFSLSDQTRNVLLKLDAPLKMHAFPAPLPSPDYQRYQDQLHEYELISKNVSGEVVDLDTKPEVARQYQVQQVGTIVLEYKGRTERATSASEQDITNAIIKLVSPQQKKIYFTQGHGEKDTVSSDREGYSAIVSVMGKENYATEKLVLAQTSAVPDDATVVVVAGAKTDFLAPEIDALKKYLDKAGKLLLEIDPPDTATSAPLTNLVGLAHDWGMDVGDDIVVDVSGMGRLFGASEAVPVAANYPAHPITQRFGYITAFPLARSVTPASGGANGHIAQTIVETSPRSWAETDVKAVLSSKPVEFNEGKDKKGPIPIAAAVSAAATSTASNGNPDAPRPETRVVVYGDSDFASNSALGIQGNKDLFMNTLGWLSQQENLISIRPKEPEDRRITMTSVQQWWVVVIGFFIIPGAIFGAGVYVWWRRR